MVSLWQFSMRIVAFLNPYLRKWLGVSLTVYLTRGHSRRQPKWSGARILTQFPKKCSHHIFMQIISNFFQDLQDSFDLTGLTIISVWDKSLWSLLKGDSLWSRVEPCSWYIQSSIYISALDIYSTQTPVLTSSQNDRHF